MDLRQVEYAVAVVDHGGFTRAAAAMHIAQPSISQSVQRLEAELGVSLFLRIGRTVRLTSAGEAFLGPARRMLRDADEVKATASAHGNLETGTLDLVALPTLVVDPLAELIGRFRAEHPNVLVRVADPIGPSELMTMIVDGRVEVGLTEGRTELKDGIGTLSLGRQELVAILPPGTPVPRGNTMSVAELARKPFVLGPPRTSTRDLVEAAFSAAGRTVNLAVETVQREGIVAMVIAGAGCGIVPASVAADAQKRGVVVARVSPRISRPIALVHRIDGLSPAAKAFLALGNHTRT
jgi:LysR family transcriptional regulator, carnitine catabolism transcriptional activator